MNDIIMWIIIGIVGALFVAFGVYLVIKICNMSSDERKALLLNFLKGAVVAAEEYIGAGHGDEKLQYVEDYFNENASWFLKILLTIFGKSSLKELIEEALSAVKAAFAAAETTTVEVVEAVEEEGAAVIDAETADEVEADADVETEEEAETVASE